MSDYNKKGSVKGAFSLLVALQKTPSLLGAECQGVGTTPLHANERGQTVSNRKVCSCYRTPSLLGDIYNSLGSTTGKGEYPPTPPKYFSKKPTSCP